MGLIVMAASLSAQSLVAQERPAAAARDTAAPDVAGDTIPAVGDTVPALADTVPAVGDTVPAVGDTIPALADTVPAVGDTIPVAADAIPEAAVVTQAANLAQPSGTAQDSLQPPVTPMGAFVRSLVIPGWGQATVDQPGRGAFYFAAEAFTMFMVIKSQSELNAASRARPVDQTLVDDKEGKRETWIVLSIFVALFSGVDAWVSAHLWDFEGEIAPPDDGSPGVQFRYNVPVEGP